MELLIRILGSIGAFIEWCLTRQCWECNGTGWARKHFQNVRCENCDGSGRL